MWRKTVPNKQNQNRRADGRDILQLACRDAGPSQRAHSDPQVVPIQPPAGVGNTFPASP